MFTYKNLAVLGLSVLLGVPTVSMAGSFTVSLIQGKTPAEAVQIIAEQIDALTGRVDKLQSDQQKTNAELQAQIDALKGENADLKAQTDAQAEANAPLIEANKRRSQCAALSAQISTKENAVRAPFEEQMKPIQDEIRALSIQLNSQETATSSQNTQATGDTSDMDALNARIKAAQAVRAQITEKRKEIDVISVEMEKALDTLHATTDFKTLQDQANALLCA